MISRQKKLLFGGTTFIIFCALLAAAELLLRIAAPGLEVPLVHEITDNGRPSYEVNRRYLEKYFPSDSPIVPELKPTIFAKQKPAKTFRVLCLGSSSMFGTPYQYSANIPSLVRKQLQHFYPDRTIEVLNFGAAAINSNVILDLSPMLVRFEPDLVLVYMGHNEFYGPEGVGASWLEQHFPAAITAKYALRNARLVVLTKRLLASIFVASPAAERNLMQQVSNGNKVSLHSPASERIFSRFASNVRGIVSVFAERRIPVVLSDLTSNLMFPPFASDTSAQLVPHLAELGEMHRAWEKQDLTQALERALRLHAIDSSNAALNFFIGSAYVAKGDDSDARPYFVRARDEDLLKFRAPTRINTILHDIARECHVPIVSADSLFRALAPNGIPGDDLFREHLHPNARGYYEIATLFASSIVGLDAVKEKPFTSVPIRPYDPDSLAIPWIDLAYGDLAIRQLTSHWPFLGYRARMDLPENEDAVLRKIAQDVYTSFTPLNEGITQTAARFMELHRYQDALTSYAALIDQYPDNYYPYYLSGNVYKTMGDIDRATRHFEAAMRCNPEYLYAPIDLALFEVTKGRYDSAIVHFTRALELARSQRPSLLVSATIHYGLAGAYANKADMTKALAHAREAVRLAPDYEAAQSLYRQLLQHR